MIVKRDATIIDRQEGDNLQIGWIQWKNHCLPLASHSEICKNMIVCEWVKPSPVQYAFVVEQTMVPVGSAERHPVAVERLLARWMAEPIYQTQ